MRSRRNDRDGLEKDLQADEYKRLLQDLQPKEPFLQRFSTWADVITFMRDGTSTDPRKDKVLRPILDAQGNEKDPRWHAILLAIFWPGLESIHYQKRGWDTDPDERWQNIVWTFLQILLRIDLKQRPDRLVQKIYNDTIHHLHDKYRYAWARTNREFSATPDEIAALAGGIDGVDSAGIELREAQEIETKRLREHLDAGRISKTDFLLLVGTRVYNKSIADYAREAGLDYQVAKKRRQRAEAVIRRFEEGQR